MRPARRLLLLLPLVFYTATYASAQETAPKPDTPVPAVSTPIKPPPQPRGRIVGTVICGDNRQSARGATVFLWLIPENGKPAQDWGNMSSHVGLNGTYTIEHVPSGDYAVVALFPGYLSVFDDLPAVEQGENADAEMRKLLTERGVTSVAPDGSSTRDLVLNRGAAISGKITYADGAPATQVLLSVEDVTAQSDSSASKDGRGMVNVGAFMQTLLMHQSQGTDDLGHFRLSGLKPGKYRLAIVQPSTAQSGMNDEMGMGILAGIAGDSKTFRFYAGDTYHRKDAKTFELRAGDELNGVEIRLPIDGFHSVRGAATAVDGRPINMGELTLTDTADDTVIFYASPAGDGTFAFPSVPPGTYTLAAKNAMIGGVQGNLPAEQAQYIPLTPTNAFADATTSVLVKDSDLSGVALTLTETAMPKTPPVPPGTVD